MRIGVASIMQETNSFAARSCGLKDFTVTTGDACRDRVGGTNSEMAGAIAAIEAVGATAVPLLHAWALPSGPVEDEAFSWLQSLLQNELGSARTLDGLVLSLHGAMATSVRFDADAELIETARLVVGEETPIGVSLDLHANVTDRMVRAADVMTGYHTDPHVDMRYTGERLVGHVLSVLDGVVQPVLTIEKRPMIVPAESMNTTTGPLAAIRRKADALSNDTVVDISLFPVQPWLDVPELGFGVLVTTNNDPRNANRIATALANEVWEIRREFTVPRLLEPPDAVAAARASSTRPFVIAESADAPSAGAAGDSPVMVAILADEANLTSVVPVVDPTSVERSFAAGVGASVTLDVGAGIDTRWHHPVRFEGVVAKVGEGRYRLAGASFTGMEVTMGRFAVIESSRLTLLLSERPAWTSDPATFRFAGIDPFDVDLLVVRSCSDFLPNYPGSPKDAVTLDVPGPATPRLERLEFERADRPLWPLDPFDDSGISVGRALHGR